MKEILPIVDEYDKIIDEVDKANFDKTTGRIYRTVSLVLFDKSGNFLIQRRAFSKATFAGKWQFSAAAGHVKIGESYLDAVYRETVEEIGLSLENKDFCEVEKVFIHTKENKRHFNLKNLAILRDEVAEIKLVNFDEFRKMIKESPDDFIDSPEFALEILEKAKRVTQK